MLREHCRQAGDGHCREDRIDENGASRIALVLLGATSAKAAPPDALVFARHVIASTVQGGREASLTCSRLLAVPPARSRDIIVRRR